MSRRFSRRAAVAASVLVMATTTSGCGLFGDDAEGSVFGIEPGECFLAPEEVEAQVGELDEVECSEAHQQEAYAVVPYEVSDPEEGDGYPGDEVLARFADGACAAAFGGYVGVDYLDSSLFFTYLAPSARSWQDEDRNIVCFVTDAGRPLEGSVKGSKK